MDMSFLSLDNNRDCAFAKKPRAFILRPSTFAKKPRMLAFILRPPLVPAYEVVVAISLLPGTAVTLDM
jgi:hypothetical protein